MANVEVPMEEEAALEARMLLIKLILCGPDNFTLSDLFRLTEYLTNEAYLKQDPPRAPRGDLRACVFRPYQAALLEQIWDLNSETRTGLTSGKAYWFLQETDENELKKSRASVIFSLNDMVDDGILEYGERSGKGGYHRVYYPKMNRDEFAKHVKKTITDKLAEVFPSEPE